MERDFTPLPSRPKGLTKSSSGASFGGDSAMSVPVLGSHPLGTLHVHQVSETPHQVSETPHQEEDDDDGPHLLLILPQHKTRPLLYTNSHSMTLRNPSTARPGNLWHTI
ncbi:hypothetical protein NXS19_007444 [Fusarium pseudograminearum]|nr:hypothetical protein NXS19_007444 [Fusarium pseudograminearum]